MGRSVLGMFPFGRIHGIQATWKSNSWHSPLKVGVTMGENIPWPLSWTGNMTWGNASVLSAAEVCSFLFFIVFNLFIYFNWRLITLKYCNAFCHTLTWISHGCTCVPHAEPCLHLPPHLPEPCFLDLAKSCINACLQSCPTLCGRMDCSPPGSSVHGILQARRQERVAMPSLSCIGEGSLKQ